MKQIISISAGVLLVILAISIQSINAQEDVGRLLKQLEEDSDRFSKTLNKGLDNSQINGTNTEDEINGYVKQFEDSCDRLKKNYDKRQDTRVSVQEVLGRGRSIDTFLKKYKLNSTVRTDWRTVKDDLNRLARAHKMRLGF